MSGIFGIISVKDCMQDLFYGTDYHSHLGTQYAGLAVWGDRLNFKIHEIKRSQFKSKFYSELDTLKGNKGIGVISSINPQPMSVNSKFGPYALCTVGFIDNTEELSKKLMKSGESFSDPYEGRINSTELVSKMINRGSSFLDGVEKMWDAISGSCSLVILTSKGIFAARDKCGRTPLVIGRKKGTWAVATESSSFLNLDIKVERSLEPGEVVFLDGKKCDVVRKREEVKQICAFLWIYTGYPASTYEGINVETVRERSGQMLARSDTVRPDLACGVPDSGTTHAIGYAMGAKVPFRRPLVKYTVGFDRSYTPPSQATRDFIAKMKLLAIKDIIKGKKLVVCDDSIVRGTQLKNFTVKKLWKSGAKEVHIRIACPPLLFPCKFLFSTRNVDELICRRVIRTLEKKQNPDLKPYLDEKSLKFREMVKWIEKDMGVTSLAYQKLDDMVKAIGLPKKDLCLYCWTGKECGRKRH